MRFLAKGTRRQKCYSYGSCKIPGKKTTQDPFQIFPDSRNSVVTKAIGSNKLLVFVHCARTFLVGIQARQVPNAHIFVTIFQIRLYSKIVSAQNSV